MFHESLSNVNFNLFLTFLSCGPCRESGRLSERHLRTTQPRSERGKTNHIYSLTCIAEKVFFNTFDTFFGTGTDAPRNSILLAGSTSDLFKTCGGGNLTLHIIICANPRCFRCTPYSFPVVDKDGIPVVSVEEDVEVGPVPSEALERRKVFIAISLLFFHDFHACYMP